MKRFIRKLLAPTGLTRRPPDHVIWRHGDPHCGERWLDDARFRTIIHNRLFVAAQFVGDGDAVIVGMIVVNDTDTPVRVDPRLSLLWVWQDEDVEREPLDRLRPTSSLPADLLEAHSVAPKESVVGELYFRRKAFGVAVFAALIEGAFYEFVITPEQTSGAIEGRT